MPELVLKAIRKTDIHGLRCTTFSTAREGELSSRSLSPAASRQLNMRGDIKNVT